MAHSFSYPEGDQKTALLRWRAYLKLLAQNQLDAWLAQRVDASDLVQQTLMDALERSEQFRGRGEAEYLAWLRSILTRNLIDAFRFHTRAKRDGQRHVPLEEDVSNAFHRVDQLVASQSTPSHRAATNELLLKLPQALAMLPAAQREAIELHHLQGLKLSETGQQMGRTEYAVVGLLHRGLKRLHELLDERP